MRTVLFNAMGAGIGDILCLLPIVENFVDRNYKTTILVSNKILKQCKNLFKSEYFNYGNCFEFIGFEDFVKEDYTYVFDLSKVPRLKEINKDSNLNRTDIYADLCGIVLNRKHKLVTVNNNLPKEKSVFISQGSTDPKRKLSNTKVINLINTFKDSYTVYYHEINDLKTEENENVINTTDWSLKEMLEAIIVSEFVVTTDNLIMHLAGVFGIKTYALFTSYLEKDRSTYYKTVNSISRNINCLGCLHTVCEYKFKCLNLDTKKLVERIYTE